MVSPEMKPSNSTVDDEPAVTEIIKAPVEE